MGLPGNGIGSRVGSRGDMLPGADILTSRNYRELTSAAIRDKIQLTRRARRARSLTWWGSGTGLPTTWVWVCRVRVASFEGEARKRGCKTPCFRLRLKHGYSRVAVVVLAKSEGRAPPPIQFIWFVP